MNRPDCYQPETIVAGRDSHPLERGAFHGARGSRVSTAHGEVGLARRYGGLEQSKASPRMSTPAASSSPRLRYFAGSTDRRVVLPVLAPTDTSRAAESRSLAGSRAAVGTRKRGAAAVPDHRHDGDDTHADDTIKALQGGTRTTPTSRVRPSPLRWRHEFDEQRASAHWGPFVAPLPATKRSPLACSQRSVSTVSWLPWRSVPEARS